MLSIILPSYREPRAYETLRITRELFPDAQIIISPDNVGRGKGWAVRKGLLASLGDIIVFLDGDMDIHPRMIKRLLPFLEDYDIVVGTKTLKGITLHRKLITLASRIYIKLLLWLDVDTQTGIKAMRRDAVVPWICTNFAFDMEFLYISKKRGLKLIEVPIEAVVSKSKGLKVIWVTLLESFRIWRRVHGIKIHSNNP